LKIVNNGVEPSLNKKIKHHKTALVFYGGSKIPQLSAAKSETSPIGEC